MIAPRWRKVLKDLWGNKTRSLLTILTIGVGIFAVGMVSSTFVIALGDMDKAYQASNPASGFLIIGGFDDELVKKIQEEVPGVRHAVGSSSNSAEAVFGPDKVYNINLAGIPSLAERDINLLAPADPGARLTLEDKEILLERSVRSVVPLKVGDPITLRFSDGTLRTLRVAGFVVDMTAPPFSFTRIVSGYVNLNTMEWLGGSRLYDTMNFTVDEKPKDQAHVTQIGQQIAHEVERTGREVFLTYTTNPGQHWAASLTAGLGVLMAGMGVLAVFLSTFLVINSISNLLTQQVRQIGVMKAVGGRNGQIGMMYLILVLVFGAVAYAIAAPLAIYMGYDVASGFADFLNFELLGYRAPVESLVLMAIIALLVPLVAAIFPIRTGTSITVREAITSYGLSASSLRRGWLDRLIDRISIIPRPLLISLRNTFRRKGRLALTVFTLTLAGAVFIAVMNMYASFNVMIPKTLGYILSDVNVYFQRAYRMQKIEPMVMRVPGVVKVEGWAMLTANALAPDKQTAVDVIMIGPPNGSTMIDPDVISGRWLLPEDENAIIIGNHFLKRRPGVIVGDELVLEINDKETVWKVVGIFQMVGQVEPPPLYVNYDYLTHLLNQIGTAGQLRVETDRHDKATQERVVNDLEAVFKENGIQVSFMQTGDEIVQQNMQVINIFVGLLASMALLIALVGGIGLMGTMSMNVMERIREVGVMRAIGARNGAIMQIVVVEGMMIGMISCGFGALLAIPISSLLLTGVGAGLLNAPLPYVYSSTGLFLWLIIVVIISALASFLPAWNATRVTIREVLAYE
jgi:putative ABC transport system permease protein